MTRGVQLSQAVRRRWESIVYKENCPPNKMVDSGKSPQMASKLRWKQRPVEARKVAGSTPAVATDSSRIYSQVVCWQCRSGSDPDAFS